MRHWQVVVGGAVLTLLAGCASPTAAGPTTSPSSGGVSSATASTAADLGSVVTVPALPGESPIGTAAGSPPASAVVTAPASPVRTLVPVLPSSAPGTTTAPPPASSSQPVVATATSRTAPPSTSSATTPAAATLTAATPTATPPTTTPSGPPATIALTGCPGCTELAYQAGVTEQYGAVLARTTQGRGVLISVDPNGATQSGINIPYGGTFAAPFGGVLPCDDGDFCIVIATNPEGHAVASAFHLLPTGAWQDASGSAGFVSDTADARAVDVDHDGLLEIAVQVAAAGGVQWLVLRRSGNAYAVLGCGSGADPPDAADLSSDACNS